ncbi:MAG: hypothetical protein FJ095_20595 [Deltaproteobacteria bacterium]|nr:hypothetical protein [Deltaproteobacteria bacterium]
MAKTAILSEDTARELVESYASLAAWFYQMSDAMRRAGVGCDEPTEAHRRAYVAQLTSSYPELGAIAAGLAAPRLFVPPPVFVGPVSVVENAGVVVAAPPVERTDGPAPPPLVDPAAVRY